MMIAYRNDTFVLVSDQSKHDRGWNGMQYLGFELPDQSHRARD